MICCRTPVRISGSSIPFAVSMTFVMSLRLIASGPPGLKLREYIIGAFASSTVLPARPPRIAS